MSPVFPSKPVGEHVIKSSLTDVYSPKVWVMQTHFWSCESTASFEEAYTALKEGLSRTLSEVPGFAGTAQRASDDPRDLVVLISSTAQVDFPAIDHTTNAAIPTYDEIKAAGFPMTALIKPFAPPVTLTAVYEGAPLLALQFNKLRGGMALSFGFSHLLADASTIAEVERIWSSHTADASAAIQQRGYKSSGDDEADRLRMSTPTPGTSDGFENPHWKLFRTEASALALPKQPARYEATLEMVRDAKRREAASGEAPKDDPKWCMWYFSPAQLARLKVDCSASLQQGEWISTMNALIGLFWSRVSILKRLDPGVHEKSTLMFPMNIRTRLDPPVHAQYIGNAVDILTTDVSVLDLTDSGKSWAVAARAIRTAVDGWTQEPIESWMATALRLSNEEALCPNPLILLNQYNVAFNDYSRSQSNTLDWGQHLGVADRTRYMKPAGSMKGCATAVIVFPRLADGGLEVATTCTDDLQSALVKDEVFRKYAELVCAFA
ncbi:hypothetical protein AMS68_006838 [Peltaster fructicola]|uniref:Trichothecene 3-O-acetyltransferase n=1 Tax=Peltaster fructicola TaxID=286661 RepID=A0A6H0Y339_9PEZI|nr:hypothetical protein AMS68_006838 [Peltaster fructicola]